MPLDFFAKEEIKDDIDRIETIIKCGIFNENNAQHPLVKSAFIEVLICLRDLMAKASNEGYPISFIDDVSITSNVNNISDLITVVRGALCHINSKSHFISETQIKPTFNISFKKGILMSIGDAVQSSEYDDDVCFFFGEQRIYLKRHIIRALEEAKQKLSPLL